MDQEVSKVKSISKRYAHRFDSHAQGYFIIIFCGFLFVHIYHHDPIHPMFYFYQSSQSKSIFVGIKILDLMLKIHFLH